ncbi:sialate O-acetylesterase [Erwinia sp. SLM-02]|uniref:sialate O-acetylesterase n=1 Tax=Erwinia sp. SLM-02 TaxID=3020057 RepID=UPI0030809A66
MATPMNNTGNALGSVAPADLQDNAQVLDELVNGGADKVTGRTGKELKSWAGMEKENAGIIESTRQNLIPLGRQYMSLAAAQADISNIALNSTTYVRSTDTAALAIEYRNVDGNLVATGRKMPSQQAVDKAASSAQQAGLSVEKKIFDDDGVEIVHALADADGKAPLTTNKLGAVGMARAEIASQGGNDIPWAITDSNRIPYIAGTPMGGVCVGNTEIVEIPGPPGIVFCDANYIPMACTPGFESDQDIPVLGGGSVEPIVAEKFRAYDTMGVRSEGQSLSLGIGAPANAPQPISITQPYGNKGFSNNNNSDTTDTDVYVPLHESSYQPSEGTWPAAETPVTGATSKLVSEIQVETGLAWDQQDSIYIGSSPGTGGKRIIDLIKGTSAYNRMIAHVTNSVRLSALEGKSHAELAVLWLQGESDYSSGTTREKYLELYLQFITDNLSDKKAITGQKFDPIFISYQLSTHRSYNRATPVIALALRDAALSGITEIAFPAYIGSYWGSSDWVHGTSEDYYMFSQYFGRMIYKKRKDMIDGVTGKIHRLDVVDEVRQGMLNTLYFNVPVPPLVFDTSWVTPAENMGFHVRNKTSLSVVDVISSVNIVGRDRVRVATTRPLTDDEVITYGWGKAGDPQTNGRVSGPRGNLRDSEGDLAGESYTDGAGVLRKLHNWCVIF